MKTSLEFNHIIDLEYFSHLDEKKDQTTVAKRDREIFLQAYGDSSEPVAPANNDLLKKWVETRVADDFSEEFQKSPGTLFMEFRRVAETIFLITGLMAGISSGLAFFSYAGTTPINVFSFLLFFVFPQLLLVLLLVAGLGIQQISPRIQFSPFYTYFLQNFFDKIFSLLKKKWLQRVPPARRDSAEHGFGTIRIGGKIYGSLSYWPLFQFSQLLGVGFNVGLITTTLIKIVSSDLAFGWQSTLQISSTGVYQAAKAFALPWSHLLGTSTGYPSLPEVEGSHIILKEGIYHLTTSDLIAWWPFLVCSLITYGLCLRITLFLLGKLLERRSLKTFKHDTPLRLALLRRMQTPLVTTQALHADQNYSEQEDVSKHSIHKKNGIKEKKEILPPNMSGQVMLIPDDISHLLGHHSLLSLLEKRGVTINDSYTFLEGYDKDQQLLGTLANQPWETGLSVFIVMEAWMVPLVDFISYSKQLRTVLLPHTPIHLALIGRPGEEVITAADELDLLLWQKKMKAIGDPYLNIFSLL